MMKMTLAAIAATFAITSAAAAAPAPSEGLFTLATTGWADSMAREGKGTAFDEVGGKPGAFEYAKDFSVSEALAAELLGEGEFTAPHWLDGFDGKDYIMVAPHLFLDGQLMKGANVNKDHFIVVDPAAGTAVRYDYSDDIAVMMGAS